VDDVGQGHQCVAGKTVRFVDREKATFIVGDAKWAYCYRNSGKGRGRLLNDFTPNDSRFKKCSLPWMDKPWSELPGWLDGKKGGDRHSWVEQHNPVEYAYRTAGLVRAARPFALIVDDFKKDDDKHVYSWLLQEHADVNFKSKEILNGNVLAIHLTDASGRCLMIAMLKSDRIDSLESILENTNYNTGEYKGYGSGLCKYDWLRVDVKDVSVLRLRTFLFPYAEGDELPDLKLAGDCSSVEINWYGEKTKVDFKAQEGDRTLVTVTANELIEVG